MEKHYYIATRDVVGITRCESQVEIHLKTGECFKICKAVLDRCIALTVQADAENPGFAHYNEKYLQCETCGELIRKDTA